MGDDRRTASGPHADATSLSLLERVRANDPPAWRRLVRLYGPVVHRWCLRAGLQESDAADVVQDLFCTLVARLTDFRRDRPGDSFRAWLWTVTANKVRDHFRRRPAGGVGGSDAQRRLAELPAADDAEPEPADADAQVLRRALELLQGEFEPATWQAFWRVQVEDQAPAEVAAALGLSANAVYKAKARVLRRLREEFGDLLD